MQSALRRRPGVTAVWVVVSLPVLLGMAALTVDVGYMCTRESEMQNAADSGALAGASGLRIDDGVARQRAVVYAGQNPLGRERVALAQDNVEIGYWEWGPQSFTTTIQRGIRPNAVRVVGRKQQLPLFFAAIFGIHETNVLRDAIALADGGRCRGIWGLEGVLGTGDIITDSYDSRNGPYGPGNIDQNGDVCSNEDIRLNGSVSIRGDAGYGPGYDITFSGGPEVWGDVAANCCRAEPPDADASVARFNNNNDTIGLSDYGREAVVGSSLRLIEDDNLTLNPGTYYLSSVRMVGQATLTVTGPTVIYVDGAAKFTGGGIVNVTRDPANLTIYASGPALDLAGGSGFYGSVVGPTTDVTLVGNAEYYGTIIGRTLDMRGTSIIHVDEAVVADLLGDDGLVVPVLVE